MTSEELEAWRTERGGWTKTALTKLGVPWPPPPGWRKRLLKEQAKKAAPKPPRSRSSLSTPWALRNRKQLLNKSNEAEEYVDALLKPIGFLYVREYAIRHDDREYFLDFVVTVNDQMIGLEVDGGGHFSQRGQLADRHREQAIREHGEIASILRFSWKTSLALSKEELKRLLEWVAAGTHHTVTLMY